MICNEIVVSIEVKDHEICSQVYRLDLSSIEKFILEKLRDIQDNYDCQFEIRVS